jgi:hypothetical protein
MSRKPTSIYDITAGDSARWSAEFSSYPTSDWTATLHLRGPDAIDLVAESGGDTLYVWDLAPQDTEVWSTGRYWWSIVVDNGEGDRRTLINGEVLVDPSLSTAGEDYDGRSDAEKTLEAIDACIRKQASKAHRRYRIGNRELDSMDGGELRKWRSYFQQIVAREKAARDGRSSRPFGRTIKTYWR